MRLPGWIAVRLPPRRHAERDQPAEGREGAEAPVEGRPADHLEHDVDLALAVRVDEQVGDVVGVEGAVEHDAHVGAAVEREVELLLGRRRRDDASGARLLRDLDREVADAAGRGVHDDGLAVLHLRGRADEVVRGEALHEERQRLRVGDAGRHVEDHGRVHDSELGVAAATGDEAADTALETAGVDDRADDLRAGDEGELGPAEVGVLHLMGVGVVDARTLHPDEELAVRRHRIGQRRPPRGPRDHRSCAPGSLSWPQPRPTSPCRAVRSYPWVTANVGGRPATAVGARMLLQGGDRREPRRAGDRGQPGDRAGHRPGVRRRGRPRRDHRPLGRAAPRPWRAPTSSSWPPTSPTARASTPPSTASRPSSARWRSPWPTPASPATP